MKSYTNIEQSKKLAEILPIESADMWWPYYYDVISDTGEYDKEPMWHKPVCDPDKALPCWSLSALLDVLDFAKCDIHKDIYGWKCYTWPNNWKYDSNWNDNPIDACYEMILKLNEQKLL